jgi:hypothetical protein
VPGAALIHPGAQAALVVDAPPPRLAVALTRAHSSRNSPSEPDFDFISKRCSEFGSDLAASATSDACSIEMSPRRTAFAVAGSSCSRRPVSIASRACATDVPVFAASSWAAERSPDFFQALVSATRAAACASIAAATFLIRLASLRIRSASRADTNAGSNVSAYLRMEPSSAANFMSEL